MSNPSWENLDDFLIPDQDGGFSIPAVFSINGVEKTVQVIFDEQYYSAELGEYTADSALPRMTGKTSDFVGIKKRTAITVDGRDFFATGYPQTDGTGMSAVTLAEEEIN